MWGGCECGTFYYLLEPVKTGSGKHIVSDAPVNLRGLPPSDGRQAAWQPGAGPQAMAYFAYALIRSWVKVLR
jgi:hypothetical protein